MLKHIILDFGGVLYDIDYYSSVEELAKLSNNPDKLRSMSFESIFHLPEKLEKGEMNENSFRNMLRSEFDISADDTVLDKAWNSMLLGLKGDAIQFVSNLKEKYSVHLLSNTNSIHYADFIIECNAFMTFFDKQYLSYKIGMRKPDKEIFDFIKADLGFEKDEAIFVDDSMINIRAANENNWNTIHFHKNLTLSELLHSIENI